MSQDVVAQHLGLTRSAVSLIESGKRKVDSLELRSFSQLVGRSVAFFLDDETATVKAQSLDDEDPTQILFSANQVVDISQDRSQIERFAQFHREFVHLARMLNRMPGQCSTQPRYNVYKPTPAAARWMANQERARLGLPLSSPIQDMRSILQSQGVRVMGWELVTPKLGGCFIFSPTLGSFVLVKRNLRDYSANMVNFVLAHEYCHDLIHRQQKGITCDPSRHYRKPEEYFAQWFAANFLMPEEALVPRLQRYLEQGEGVITPETVMNLALDFGVSYTAMLNRMSSKGVELIDAETRKQLEKAKVTNLLVQIGRTIPRFEINQFPVEYVDMAFEAYSLGQISLGKLAELLDVPIEEAKAQLEKRGVPIDLGVSSEDDLFRDIENA
ncbi:ImmA/IrrE family metallo-endopeptidase [Thermocoleostomius sinensis]|uniref:ImmA/IrrE family metallo-endopeptidase n=1 Tax=Thermocoleostomius sinensis A174 TaxID=2016057 RepID=A0A9E8ZMH6_9CYAN|nr:ImmA/IrrE family metallo-endopeptidase [Thermocoleostomius sinensis]WAL61211.1 ImmA/IrrE family metallo-endopeptidase [Thermocoleostomius sinensis A174]